MTLPNLSVLGLVVLIFLAGPSMGQDLHPGIIGDDDRVPVSEEGPPWDAIGQVNISSYRRRGQCTGTLVAPDIVITAAHCVMDPWKRTPLPLKDIHFVAGVHGSKNKGHATAKCLHFPKDYDFAPPHEIHPALPEQEVSAEALYKDAVAIVLNEKLNVEPAQLVDGVVGEPGLDLVHAAYPADHRFALTVHFHCQLLRADLKGPLWLHDCDTHPASSGGPLFVEIDRRLKLSAILVASGQRIANYALPVSEWRELARDSSCP